MKEGYKKTEIGVIPEDWEVKKLEDVATIIMGQSPSSDSYNDDKEGLPFFQGNSEFGRIHPKVKKWCSEPIKVVEPLDVLISVRAPVGAVNVNTVKSCIGRGLGAIRSDKNNNYRYLYYVLVNSEKILNSSSQGSTFTAINSGDLKSLNVAIPPLKEQEKIAEILSTVDGQIDDTEMLIEKCRVLKKGLMQRLLSKGIGHLEFKMSEVGEIPVGWEVRKLDEISCITRLAGAEYSDLWQPIEQGEIIALRGYNIGSNKLMLDNVERISKELSNRLNRSKLYKNDIVFPCVGTIGKAAVIHEDDKYHINQNIAKITPNEDMHSLYLSYYLISEYVKVQIFKYNTSSSQPNVLVGNLRKFSIVVPPRLEQEKIAKVLSSIDNEIEEYENKKQKLEELKKGLMQQLLTGKVRVIV